MKIVVLFFCIIFLSTNYLFAQESSIAAKPLIITRSVLGGIVKSVTLADSIKGTESEMVLITPAKKKINILLTSTTTIWNSKAEALLQEKIVPKAHVNVIYLITPEGLNIAKSIKILK